MTTEPKVKEMYEGVDYLPVILNTSLPEWSAIPEHMHDGLQLWLYYGNRIRPGSFLQAVLDNNLFEAVRRADDANRKALPAYVIFFYNHTPHTALSRDFTGIME